MTKRNEVTLWATTLGDELPIAVEYEFEPGEPEVRYYKDGSGYPGSPATVSVVAVHIAGAVIEPQVFAEDILDRWEERIMEMLDDQAAGEQAERAERERDYGGDEP